uniref:Uncharacterized protein n=1 Tax=Panagrolaimus sp. ES5 TaxID=591445 RepID=A0AC34GNW0_9BILA
MKEFYLFFVCLFVITLVGSVEYDGDQRFYTTVIDGKTHVALHVLKEPIKLIFPKDISFNGLAPDMQLYSPTGNGKCEDTEGTLQFTLRMNADEYIQGTVMAIKYGDKTKVRALFYEKCYGNKQRFFYKYKLIEEIYEPLTGGYCFASGVPFQVYEKDNTKHVMDLQVNGTFNCQVFMTMPPYMEVEDLKMNDTGKLELNETFAGHDDHYLWTTENNNNDEMLPNGISFDGNKSVKINLLNSTVMIPYFFRIGINQPVPSLKFEFGEKCNGAKFGFFLNLRDKIDCKYVIHLHSNGFNFFSRNVQRGFFVSTSPKKMTLNFGKYLIYVKVDYPLMIKSYEACELTNSPNVPSDQFVLQIAPSENIGECEKAEIILPKSDVFGDIEVLIDRSKIVENVTELFENSTLFSSTLPGTSAAVLNACGFLFLVLFVAAILIFVFFIRRGLQRTIAEPKF